MPLGSSSAAPVTSPGPSFFQNDNFASAATAVFRFDCFFMPIPSRRRVRHFCAEHHVLASIVVPTMQYIFVYIFPAPARALLVGLLLSADPIGSSLAQPDETQVVHFARSRLRNRAIRKPKNCCEPHQIRVFTDDGIGTRLANASTRTLIRGQRVWLRHQPK